MVTVAARLPLAGRSRWRGRACWPRCPSRPRTRIGRRCRRATMRARPGGPWPGRRPGEPAAKLAADGARREVATSHLHDRVLVAVLRGPEPPDAALDQGAAEPDRILLAIERRLGAAGAVGGGGKPLERVVAEEERRRAREGVAPRLRDHRDRGSRRAALLGGEPVRRDLELLNGVERQVRERAAHDVVVVVLAVDADVPPAAELAGGRHGEAVRLGGIEVRRGRIAGHEQAQLEEVAAVQGEVLDRGGGDHVLHRPSARSRWAERRIRSASPFPWPRRAAGADRAGVRLPCARARRSREAAPPPIPSPCTHPAAGS